MQTQMYINIASDTYTYTHSCQEVLIQYITFRKYPEVQYLKNIPEEQNTLQKTQSYT
jgi:hypothetical protein